MLQAIIAGLVVAAVTGLTILAYRHPAAYKKIHNPLLALAMVIFLLFSTWYNAVLTAQAALIPFIAPGKMPEADAAVKGIVVPFTTLLVAYLGFTAFTVGLLILPALTREQPQKEGDEGPRPEDEKEKPS